MLYTLMIVTLTLISTYLRQRIVNVTTLKQHACKQYLEKIMCIIYAR